MTDVFVIGTACTAFGKLPHRSFKDLTRETYLRVLTDAQLPDGGSIGAAWFGNCGMGTFGQRNIRGQVCFTPLVREGSFPERVPIINVEGACATGSLAFHGAWKDVASADVDLSLAIGVEKTFVPGDPARTRELLEGGIDCLDPQEWHDHYRAAGETMGTPFAPNARGGTIFLDTYAMQAAHHIKTYGTTQQQIAECASKNHAMGARNPLAQYRFEMTPQQVMADRVVSYPLTRAMCSPIGDGAAAALLCSASFLRGVPRAVRDRAIRVRASALSGGKYRPLGEPSLTVAAARKAYGASGIAPDAVDVAELHDATSFCEIYQAEMLGFCPIGQGGPFVSSGASSLGGRLPINLSGGLVSKGHPVGATGLSMIHELVLQLRKEAGARQAQHARVALAQNGGGVIGFDEAVCSVVILEA